MAMSDWKSVLTILWSSTLLTMVVDYVYAFFCGYGLGKGDRRIMWASWGFFTIWVFGIGVLIGKGPELLPSGWPSISEWVVLIGYLGAFLIVVYIGFRIGRNKRKQKDDKDKGEVKLTVKSPDYQFEWGAPRSV